MYQKSADLNVAPPVDQLNTTFCTEHVYKPDTDSN